MKKKKQKRNRSTRAMMHIKTLHDACIETPKDEVIYYLSIQPPNLSVMSSDMVEGKVVALTHVLKSIGTLEILVLNSRDNFEQNKLFIQNRLQEETQPNVKKCLQQDLRYLDEIQIRTATSRLFLFVIRMKEDDEPTINNQLNRVEKNLRMQGFQIKRLQKQHLKAMLAVYYEQNVTTEVFEKMDGERWIQDETNG
ncbi:hypothetical protein PT251_06755 [Erysipelothrix rhusiopathiae]|nr:hypothetical protein [Erysipelothrix rhusiopathiae]